MTRNRLRWRWGLVLATLLLGLPLVVVTSLHGPDVGAARTAQADGLRFDVIANVGGQLTGLTTVGGRPYLAQGRNLWSVDLSNLATPQWGAQSGLLPGQPFYLRPAGSRLVVVSGPLVSDPDAGGDRRWWLELFEGGDGRELSRLGAVALDVGDITAMAVEDDRAVLLSDQAVLFVDLTEPAKMEPQPLHISLPKDLHRFRALAFVGGRLAVFANVSLGRAGVLQVLNVDDPSQPQLLGELAFDDPMRDVPDEPMAPAGDGSLVVLIGYNGDGGPLARIDIDDAGQPRLRDQVLLPLDDYVSAVTVEGSRVAVVTYFGRILVADLDGADGPRLVANHSWGSILRDAKLDGGRLLIAGDAAEAGRNGLSVLDIADPERLPLLGRLEVPPEKVSGLVLDGDTLYLAGRGPHPEDGGALWAIDVADPARPRPIRGLHLPVHGARLARADRLLLTAGGQSGAPMRALTIDGPGLLRPRGSADDGTELAAVVARDSHAYVGDKRGLLPVRITDPDRLEAEPAIWAEGLLLDLSLAGSRLYTAGEGGFSIFQLSDPARPRRVWSTSFADGSWVTAVAGDATRAVVAVAESLRLFDVTNASAPRELGRTSLGQFANVSDLVLSGDLAFARTDQALLAFDIASSDAPRLLGQLDLPFDSRIGAGGDKGLLVAGDLVFVVTAQLQDLYVARFQRSAPPLPTRTPARDSFRALLPLLRSGPEGSGGR